MGGIGGHGKDEQMKTENFVKAQGIAEKIKCLNDLDVAFGDYCPVVKGCGEKANSYLLVGNILDEWKKLNHDFFQRKIDELKAEFESL